jgi:putative tryptophan/tyrosine transport system substrate-binding protein
MKRRHFTVLFAGAAGTLPFDLSAQQNLPLVGFLNGASPDTYRFNADSFRQGLAKAGFVEGKTVRIEERWARGDYQTLPALAADLVALGVVAIAATGDVASARAAQAATRTIPIVFTIGADPVRFGLVASLNRPGGNTTGINLLSSILAAKRLELLSQIAPEAYRVALLMNPNNLSAEAELADAEAGAKKLGREILALRARDAEEIDKAFAELMRAKADAFISGTDPIPLDRRHQIVSFAAKERKPAAYFVRQFVDIGGLLSYGPSISWMYRQAGEYVGAILKGAKPADMPVLQPTEYECVLNLRTANALGLAVPMSLHAAANDTVD